MRYPDHKRMAGNPARAPPLEGVEKYVGEEPRHLFCRFANILGTGAPPLPCVLEAAEDPAEQGGKPLCESHLGVCSRARRVGGGFGVPFRPVS